MSLFVDDQIPSDLLSYDGHTAATLKDKVTTVRGYVKAVMDVIDTAKKHQLESERQKAQIREEMAVPEAPYTPREYHTLGGSRTRSSATSAGSMRTPPSIEGVQTLSYKASEQQSPVTDITNTEKDREAIQESSNDVPPRRSTSGLSLSHDDFTMIPKLLDSLFEKSDKDGALKSTVIKTQDFWYRSRQENLLVKSQKTLLSQEDVGSETTQAMDLLRASSRSGSLPIESSELHVIVAVSYCFENEIMETLIEDNINPIEKVERAMLMVASVIHDVPELQLMGEELLGLIDSENSSS